jgi:hypothetical protein
MLVFNQIFIAVLLISVLLFAIKYFQKASYQKTERRRIPYKWMLWFSKSDIYSTTSNDYRRYMKSSNGLSLAFWASILVSIIIFILLGYVKARA